MARSFRQRFAFACSIAGCVAIAALQQGCYKRVVAVRGLGGSAYQVSEPYQENSKIDDWVFGTQPTPGTKIVRPPQD